MGQIILAFDQNLLERSENAMQIERNHYIKDNMGQIVLLQIQFLMNQTALSVLSLDQNLLEVLQNST